MNLSPATQQRSLDSKESADSNNLAFGKITGTDDDRSILRMVNTNIFPSIDETLIDENLEDIIPNFIIQSPELVPSEISPSQNYLFLENAENTVDGDIRSCDEEFSSTIYDVLLMPTTETVAPFEQSTEINLNQNPSMINELGLQMDINAKTFNNKDTYTSQQFFWHEDLAPENKFLCASRIFSSGVPNLPNTLSVSPVSHSDNCHGEVTH